MGNEPTSQNSQNSQSMSTEWSGSARFGNGYRTVDFFDKHFDIPGKIVNVEEIVYNRIVLVVNKVQWYGLRLIICDHRGCGYGEPEKGDYEVLKLTTVWGIGEESISKHIQNIKYYFQSPVYVCQLSSYISFGFNLLIWLVSMILLFFCFFFYPMFVAFCVVLQADAPWEILKKEYNIDRKYPPRRLVALKVDIDGMPSEAQRKKVIETLIPGDILIIKRPKGYYHYAIYVGNDDVIHIDHKANGGGVGMF